MRLKPVEVNECEDCGGVFYTYIDSCADYCPFCGEEEVEHVKTIEIVIE